MKRSELVEGMARYWFGLFPGEPLFNMNVEPEMFEEIKEKMSSLLKHIEHKGMLPPYRQKSLEEKEMVDAINQYEYCHRWEDEKK